MTKPFEIHSKTFKSKDKNSTETKHQKKQRKSSKNYPRTKTTRNNFLETIITKNSFLNLVKLKSNSISKNPKNDSNNKEITKANNQIQEKEKKGFRSLSPALNLLESTFLQIILITIEDTCMKIKVQIVHLRIHLLVLRNLKH